MMPNDMIEICRIEYDRLVDALNQNKLLREELEEVTAERDAVAADRDRITAERAKLSDMFLQKCDTSDKQESELLWLRGFHEAVKIMCGSDKLPMY